MKRVIIIRHGKVNINSRKLLSSKEFNKWVDEYNRATIITKQNVNSELKTILDEQHILVCSSLNRSVTTAKYLQTTPSVQNELFNEFQLPKIDIKLLKFPPSIWLGVTRILWFLGFANECESFSNAKTRVKRAVEEIVSLSNDDRAIVLIGHGLINRFLEKELQKKGWITQKKFDGNYLGFGVFEKE